MEGLATFVQAVSWPVAILVGTILVFILAKSGNIKSLKASRDGLSLDMNKVDKRENFKYYMDKRIISVDDTLSLAAKRATKGVKRSMVHAVTSSSNCAMTKIAMRSMLMDPLFDACDENDFKTHLAYSNKQQYIDTKVDAIHDIFNELVDANETGCAADDGQNDMVQWNKAEGPIRHVVDRWASQIVEAVMDACRKKIDIYNEYLPHFRVAKDSYFIKVVEHCIEKNQAYIENLGGEP